MQNHKQVVTMILVYIVFTSLLDLVSTDDNSCKATDSWYIPNLLGAPILVTVAELAAYIRPSTATEDDVQFLLLTNLNPTEPCKISIGDVRALNDSQFNPNHETYFIIHGWLNNGYSYMCKILAAAVLARNNINVFIVDWGKRAMNGDYRFAAMSVEPIGGIVADFMNFLCRVFAVEIYVIGHSLGAHVAGFAGKKFDCGTIKTIWGLDPAQPLFDYCNSKKRLCNTDAFYVEILHTNAGFLGFEKPIGNASFYANGGRMQKGCGIDAYCSHMGVIGFCDQAQRGKRYTSVACATYTDATNNACGSTPSGVFMALPTNNNINGIFYVGITEEAGFTDGFPYFIASQILP
ncbi:phospholipase A1-like [Zeugodacus cucurbitae]|uniref:Endothelial lipase n=1 Tax=Zeugodacus cucurbitae TaxID=28588 RepID=A0A0A1WZ50_ZEUCU|nr:phospholipase A1-like [Zeugodacus cucurbitae]